MSRSGGAGPNGLTEITLRPGDVTADSGRCWTADVIGVFGVGDEATAQERSTVELFEDGRPLGPGHAAHSRIREHGRGLYSHWNGQLYFASSDNTSPLSNGRTYVARGPLQPAVRAKSDDQPRGEPPVFPRIKRMHDALEGSSLSGVISADGAATDQLSRIRMLEAKVEYLLDEVYSLKSMLRWHRPTSEMLTALHQGQLATFNFQWQRLPYHDNFLSNPEWRGRATADLCRRVEREPDWFRGKKVLDCGCGPGRHSWVFGSLGAQVTAFDTSENGIANARKECEGFPDVTIEYRNILEPLPYSRDYDLVWCYGVVHCTGDTFGALRNITRHLRPGGLLYFMVYAEPSRGEFGEYVYYHEVMAMRQALIGASLEERARVLSLVEGDTQALGWFDAVSSQINDLYTVEELFQMLDHLGFEDIRRTTPDERNLNITAVKRAAENP